MRYHKYLLIIFLLFLCVQSYSQKIEDYDTILVENCYKSFYNYKIKAPSFVIYKLYNGGGDISRNGIGFKTKKGFPHFNYVKSGYDRGHLCPAEDFAYDLDLMKSTFYYHNAIPQTMKLNRGNWKKYENIIRAESKKDSLLIICGGCDYNNGLIPSKCFKIVYSLSSKKLKYCILIDNNNRCNIIINKRTLVKKYTYNYIINLYYEKSK